MFIPFLFSSTVTFLLYYILNILRYFVKLMSRLLHSTIHQVMWYFWVFTENPFSLLCSVFFSRKLCFLWSPCLLLIAESISLDTSGKPTVGFFLKIASSSCTILSVSLDELNSSGWLLKSWWWRISLIIFWILLRMSTSLVIWNLNITEHYPEILLQVSLK